MANKKVTLFDLKVPELRQELEERDLDSTGNKTVLQKRLLEHLVKNGVDPEAPNFEVPYQIGDLMAVLEEHSRNMEKLKEKLDVRFGKFEVRVDQEPSTSKSHGRRAGDLPNAVNRRDYRQGLGGTEDQEDGKTSLLGMRAGWTYKESLPQEAPLCRPRSKASGKLERVDRQRQLLTRKSCPKKKFTRVAVLKGRANSLYVTGVVNGGARRVLLDTGATMTIIRPEVVATKKKLLPSSWRLRAATGEAACVYGETVGRELVLGPSGGVYGEAMLAEDVVIPSCSEIVAEACVSAELAPEGLTRAPMLSCPRPEGGFVLDADASNVGVGGVLSQMRDGHEKVVAYFSEVLSKPERNCCVTRRELLAVVESVEHRAGINHRSAGALSGGPCVADCSHCQRVEDGSTIVGRVTVQDDEWTDRSVLADQESDPDLKYVLKWKRANQRPTWEDIAPLSRSVKSYWSQWDSLVLEDDLLKRVLESEDGTKKKFQLIIPRKRVAEVLKLIHDGVSGGHLGIHKTLEKVRERFYWINCTEDVRDWCRRCVSCATANGPQGKRRAPMRQYDVGNPFKRIAIDIAGPFPTFYGLGKAPTKC
jgi:hypothetical protein